LIVNKYEPLGAFFGRFRVDDKQRQENDAAGKPLFLRE
jgi:hypothetical protein